MLGLEVEANGDTSWKGLVAPAVGTWVDVGGAFDRQGLFQADVIRRPDPVNLLLIAVLAVILIAAMFIFGHAFSRCGVAEMIGHKLLAAGGVGEVAHGRPPPGVASPYRQP